MKKRNIIIIISILVIIVVAILGFLYYDDVKTRDTITGYSTDEKLAYSLDDKGNFVELTTYSKQGEHTKTKIIYTIENNFIKEVHIKRYFINNKFARMYMNEKESKELHKKRINNIVEWLEPSNTDNRSKDELMQDLEKYKDIYTKI